MKAKEPLFVTEWRHIKAPQCCHTCDNYLPNGECRIYHTIPPEEFASKVNECEFWDLEIVF